LRGGLSARPPRRARVGGGKMWGRGERRLSFAGKTGTDSVVHIPPYSRHIGGRAAILSGRVVRMN
jgi:hypothetical protein